MSQLFTSRAQYCSGDGDSDAALEFGLDVGFCWGITTIHNQKKCIIDHSEIAAVCTNLAILEAPTDICIHH